MRSSWTGVRWLALVLALASAGCELTQITLATPDDIIVAEILLRAGASRQTAYLHRTGGGEHSANVIGAVIRIEEENSPSTMEFKAGADSLCVNPLGQQSSSIGTCYVAEGSPSMVRPGTRYTLRIDVDGRVLTASTQVPGTFAMVRPARSPCRVPTQTVVELEWTRAAGAWAYVAEARFEGLSRVLIDRGVPTLPRPIELTGLSVSGADTTLLFPTELGVFQRFDADMHAILLAIAEGLPPGNIQVDVTLAAGDRNYVNWVRGGAFNPSGQVRIPSIHGGGTGVFGSLVPVNFTMRTQLLPEPVPPCL